MDKDITICLTYFKSLALANLSAALHSVRRQDLSRVELIVIFDNDTYGDMTDVFNVVDACGFLTPFRVLSVKHRDATKTHSWSTNQAVREVKTPWVLFTRADYVLDPEALAKMLAVVDAHPPLWDGFVTGNVYHLHVDVGVCEASGWREHGAGVLRSLPGVENDYTQIDAGVWLARKQAFDRVSGMNESLTLWGHAQTHFQHKLYVTGTEFVRISEPLFYHPLHAAPRDLESAHAQLRDQGIDLREMWARHDGAQPY